MTKISNMFGGESLDVNCIACGLQKDLHNSPLRYSGKGRLGILIVGEPPGYDDLSNRRYLTDKWGKFLSKEFSKIGMDLYLDFWITSPIQCACSKKPTEKQIKLCRNNLEKVIEELKPRFIVPMGSLGCKFFFDGFLKSVNPMSLNGRQIPLHSYDAWCLPLMGASTVFNKRQDTNMRNYYNRTIRSMMKFIKEDYELPYMDPFKDIVFLHTPEDIKFLIDGIIKNDILSGFDFETTGFDPWRKGHHITTMAIATEEKSYAFAIEHPEAGYTEDQIDDIMDSVCDYLESDYIEKVGHNVNFDKMWGHWVLGAITDGVFRCTMNTSHILDHRQGNNSLKDAAFIRWGITNYDSDASLYIKALPGEPFNRMMKMPLNKQLLYVGADARLTIKLHIEQQEELTEAQKKADLFFMNALETLYDLQNNGLIVDDEYYRKVNAELSDEIDEIENRINNSDDAKEYTKKYKKEFKYSSPNVLKTLLFKMRGIKAVKFTDKDNESVDEEALGSMDYWMCKDIIKLRKLEKLRGTYIKQYLKGIDGVVHPTFQLHTVTSYRSSCKDPNIQNTPKRNPYAKNLIRRGMIPPKGWKMFEVDVSGCEVSTSAMYHKDPTFMEYLFDPSTDMHRDNTSDLWLCDGDQVTKMMRFFGKNMWTFAQFYGDYFGSCGPNLWNTCLFEEKLVMADGTLLKDHIFDMGITELGEMVKGHCTPGSFLEHCQKVEDKMWNERFPVYTQWKKDVNDFYNENGYVETFLGFKYTGYLDSKQTTNFPVQGTAFHLLMWALHQSNLRLKNENWESYIIGEVHDSMIGYVHPDEESELFPMIKEICSVDLPRRFDFVNVPFEIEVELSETNGNFAELEEIEI